MNITWHDTKLTKKEREKRNGHKGAVLWLTGLSGSGKSTLAVELQCRLFERGHQAYVLDGDNIRHGLNKNLGFSPADRTENIRRVGEVAKLFYEAGFLVITSFISPYRKDREAVRGLLPKGDFIEVHVKAALDNCEKRDPKGLYRKARRGEISDFTGVTAPYEEPAAPELILKTDEESKDECVRQIIDYLEANNYIKRTD
ncbi:MAG: adenylyl-sulfate kinase [Candidatus Margulisbacteria bacterium]|nr:adenylyl-sulfate kinase [Candidatus Margulisiibacteriota bacterium]